MTDTPRSLDVLIALIPPTFKRDVALPHPAGNQEVEFEFRTRDRPELADFTGRLAKGMTDEKAIAEVATGWNLSDKFTAANIKKLCLLFPGAGHAIVQEYLQASTGMRALP